MTQNPQFEKCSQVPHLFGSNSEAFLKRGGLVGYLGFISVVAVLAPPRRKEVGDAYAVVDHLAVHEHRIILLRFLLGHMLPECFPAY